MKISIYGDSFVTSGIFKSTLMSQIGNDHNFKLKDVNWPDTPFHNDFGEGNFSKIKEYLGNEEDVINFIEDSEILVTDLAPVSESILDNVNGIKKVSLENLLETSDVVSIHARVTKETVNLIGKKEISLMKKDSYLINTARGPLLDYKALHDALSNGKLKGAALDTFYEEPLPKNHIFKNLNNVTITPHIAGASVKTAYYAAEVIAKDVRNYIDGKKLVNRIC